MPARESRPRKNEQKRKIHHQNRKYHAQENGERRHFQIYIKKHPKREQIKVFLVSGYQSDRRETKGYRIVEIIGICK